MTRTHTSPSSRTLPTFEEAEGLGPRDAAFVRDLVAVLEKHGNLDRFGLCLLHGHFPLATDEVLVETNDPATRTLHARVEPAARTRHIKPSQWRFAPHDTEPGTGPYQAIMLCKTLDLCPGRRPGA